MTSSATDVYMDGPPVRQPERVAYNTPLRGRRVTIWNAETGEWIRDLRAADEPYWYDAQTPRRWPAQDPDSTWVAPMEMALRAVLHVAVVTEADWYQWHRDHRRPEVREYPAYLVWTD